MKLVAGNSNRSLAEAIAAQDQQTPGEGPERGERMEMAVRQRELHEQRKQRQSRAAFDVRTEPLHVGPHPRRELNHPML